MKVIITAGGTGGHIYPALSIINKIKEMDKKADFLYIGTTDRMEKDIIPNKNIDYIGIKISGLSKNPFKLIKALYLNIVSVFKCKKIIKKFNPDIVIGVGGYVTVPVLYSAYKLGIPTVLHEQNSIPGKANKFLSKYVDKVCVSVEKSAEYFPSKKVVFTGNPRGEEVTLSQKASKEEYDLSLDKKLLLITTGSLSSSSVNQKILELIPRFEGKNYEILFITGNLSFKEINKGKYPSNVKIVPYIEKMGEVLKITDLIISRAGATTISEITALGIPSILIPSPYVPNNHQYYNAKELSDNKAAYIVEEKGLDPLVLLELVDKILLNNKEYQDMANNARKLGVPDSASRIYNVITSLVNK